MHRSEITLHTPVSPPPPNFSPLKPRAIAARPSFILAALGICAFILAFVFVYAVQAQGQEVTPTKEATGETSPARPHGPPGLG